MQPYKGQNAQEIPGPSCHRRYGAHYSLVQASEPLSPGSRYHLFVKWRNSWHCFDSFPYFI